MKKQPLIVIAMVILLSLLMAGCNSAQEENDQADNAARNSKTFTQEELAEYDGKNGNPAYIAVDGTVYDVSDEPEWENGEH